MTLSFVALSLESVVLFFLPFFFPPLVQSSDSEKSASADWGKEDNQIVVR
jgi:hypothetical protein